MGFGAGHIKKLLANVMSEYNAREHARLELFSGEWLKTDFRNEEKRKFWQAEFEAHHKLMEQYVAEIKRFGPSKYLQDKYPTLKKIIQWDTTC